MLARHRPAARRQGPAEVHGRSCRSTGVDDAWTAGDSAAVPDLTKDDPDATTAPERAARRAAGQAARRQHRRRAARRAADAVRARVRRLGGQPRACTRASPQVYGIKLRGLAGLVHAPHLPRVRVPTFNRKVRVVADWTLACSSAARSSSLGPAAGPAPRVRVRREHRAHRAAAAAPRGRQPTARRPRRRRLSSRRPRCGAATAPGRTRLACADAPVAQLAEADPLKGFAVSVRTRPGAPRSPAARRPARAVGAAPATWQPGRVGVPRAGVWCDPPERGMLSGR